MALETMSTGNVRFTRDTVAQLETSYGTANRNDLTTVFMS